MASGPVDLPAGAVGVHAPFAATVWQVAAEPGADLADGERVVALEAMKMETAVNAPARSELLEVYVKPGEAVTAGQVLFAVRPLAGVAA